MLVSQKSLKELRKQVSDGFQEPDKPLMGFVSHTPYLADLGQQALNELAAMLEEAAFLYGYTPGCPAEPNIRSPRCLACYTQAGSDKCAEERTQRRERLLPS